KRKATDKTKKKAKKETKDGETKPKRAAPNNNFNRPLLVSSELSEVVGTEKASRPEIVKGIWAHIKANNLQDEADRRYILCDEKLTNVFKVPRVSMFQMNKLLSSHLKAPEE
ncbi:SWIB/MDM2 domain-containing protein, partial [Dimargaris cristalligena]